MNYVLNQFCEILTVNPELPSLFPVFILIPISFAIFIIALVIILFIIGRDTQKKLEQIIDSNFHER